MIYGIAQYKYVLAVEYHSQTYNMRKVMVYDIKENILYHDCVASKYKKQCWHQKFIMTLLNLKRVPKLKPALPIEKINKRPFIDVTFQYFPSIKKSKFILLKPAV